MDCLEKSNEVVNKVFKTNDLSIFKSIRGNRPPNPKHISRLRESIKVNGILQNPIIVNEKFDVIDGQHRLLAAKEANSSIYYIVAEGYSLSEVQTLNLNQKNWTKRDFLDGYADMGIESYVNLRDFIIKNKEFNLRSCIAMCSNKVSGSCGMGRRYIDKKLYNTKEVFEEGTWRGRDFGLGQDNADKIKMIKPYYDGYAGANFVSAMLGLFKNKNFNINHLLKKLEGHSQKIEHCATVSQYRIMIEDIYNYRSRKKVNIRF